MDAQAQAEEERTGLEIAVIGMAGRFPGAKDLAEFWNNLRHGMEPVSFFSKEELLEVGESEALLENPGYVPAKAILEDIDRFDAGFFNYTPAEAEQMDPQSRLFLEYAWTALENAAYTSSYKGLIGFYAGASSSFSWEALKILSGSNGSVDLFSTLVLKDKDFLATRASYKLGLTGSSYVVHTACSTSLTAIHIACRSLLMGECDIALAGGVSVTFPRKNGYMYVEGMTQSPDGHCRAFAAEAKGTLVGEGVGVVVLKPLEEALSDGDFIYAVIKGSACNNDGPRRVGYTAPSIEGQAECIRTALRMARVEPEHIRFIETHGTGTELGDPIEIEALKLAFDTDKKNFCGIGSLKSNIGHLDTAAGAASFIKTVLALYHRALPPSLHFEHPNPKIDFENSPFYINTKLSAWHDEPFPLRAGISSFGIGGTNVHVVLEEWCEVRRSDGQRAELPHLIPFSAKSETALEKMTENLVDHLKQAPGLNLADAAFTLQMGREVFRHRRMAVCSTVDEVIAALSDPGNGKVSTFSAREENQSPPVVFMFSGLGGEYVKMGRDLYEKEPVFRQEMDRCFKVLGPIMGYDLKVILYPGNAPQRTQSAQRKEFSDKTSAVSAVSAVKMEAPDIERPENSQPLTFIFEYALAKLLMHWDINPSAMVGYSFGEYTAACIAGVFSLEDALELVVARGRLIHKTETGAMLSVPLSKEELLPLLPSGLSLAIDNDSSCIVAGAAEAMAAFEKQMKEQRCLCMPLPFSTAIHSSLMDPIAKELEDKIGKIKRTKPEIPYISNVTGTWISAEQAIDPGYWSTHLRQTVRFADGIKVLVNKMENALFVEIGPGRDISALVVRYIENNPGQRVIHLVRPPQKNVSDMHFLLRQVGRMWLYGKTPGWQRFHTGEKRLRTPLPTYPFEGQRYPAEGNPFAIGMKMFASQSLLQRKPDISDWFYIPSWKRSGITAGQPVSSCWLVFADGWGLGARLIKQLEQRDQAVIPVKAGAGYFKDEGNRNAPAFTINPSETGDYDLLFAELRQMGRFPGQIVHLWNVTGGEPVKALIDRTSPTLELGFHTLVNIARAVGNQGSQEGTRITVVTDNMQEVNGSDLLYPEKAAVLGPVKVIPTEYPNISCRSIDVDLSREEILPGETSTIIIKLVEELFSGASEPVTAYRGKYRWVQNFEPLRLEKAAEKTNGLREKGVYLITGGLGGVGLVLAGYLAAHARARLALTGRRGLPPREQWEACLEDANQDSGIKEKIRRVRELEELGSEVLVFSADTTDSKQMEQVLAVVRERFGPLNGILHCAGTPDGEIIQRRSRETSERILAPKIKGTLVLHQLVKDMEFDFFIICSSLNAILPAAGQVGYCAANAFQDAFANYYHGDNGRLVEAINWDRWQNTGMSLIVEDLYKKLEGRDMEGGITVTEGLEIFERILANPMPQVAVFPLDLDVLLERAISAEGFLVEEAEKEQAPGITHQRSELGIEYAVPRNENEKILAEVWAGLLGYDRVGIYDDFFDLGGDSLKAMTASSQIHARLNVRIPAAEFFKSPTIEKMAEYINTAVKQKYSMIEPVEKKEYYPLSASQKRLYMLQQIDLDSEVYNMPLVVILEGKPDREKPGNVFRKLIHRHEGFRTSFITVEDEVVQKIHEKNVIDFKAGYYDLSSQSQTEEASGNSLAAENIVKNFIRPFHLDKAPLLRMGLIKLQEEKHILMIDNHHIISDGTSQSLFMEEFSAYYGDKEDRLSPLNIQYKDYAVWQNSEEGQKAFQLQEEYWLKEFAGEIPAVNLPLDFPRPDIQSFEGRLVSIFIDKEHSRLLKKIAREQGVSLFAMLLAIFNIFVAKVTGRDDICVGTEIAGRGHSEVQNIQGLFLNTLVLRNFPHKDKTFAAFLEELMNRILQAFENQEYPFEMLTEKVLGKRDVRRNPFFDVMLVWQNMDMEPLQLPGLTTKPYHDEVRRNALVDMTIYGYEQEEFLAFALEYNTSLFEETTIQRFITYFKEIIAAIAANREIKLKEIKISHDLQEAAVEVFREEDEEFGF